jgi:membrane protease YdiL (CAAX protease family)
MFDQHDQHTHAGRYSLPFLIYFGYTLTKGLWLNDLDNTAFWFADFLSFVALPALLVVVFRLPVRPEELRDVERCRRRGFWVPVVVNGFLIAFAIRMITVISAVELHKRDIDDWLYLPPTISYVGRMPESGPWFYVGVIYLALSAAVVEEYCYRFLLRRAMQRYTSRLVPFVVLSALTFSLVHWGNGLHNMTAAFFVGLLLAFSYAKADDLRLPVTGHAFYWLRLLWR